MVLLTSFLIYIITYKCCLFQMHYPNDQRNQELLKYHSLFYYFLRWLFSLIVDIISFLFLFNIFIQ